MFWPFFDLVIRTPQLTLRYPDDDRAAALMDLVATVGIHDPAYMPFAIPWTRFNPASPSPGRCLRMGSTRSPTGHLLVDYRVIR